MTTKLQLKQLGQSREQAKGAKRKAVVIFKLGYAICDAMEAQGETVRSAICALKGVNLETVLQTMQEVIERRDAKVKAIKGEKKDKRIASVRVMYSRISVILKAIHAKLNLDKIFSAASFAEMYAYASRKATSPDKRSSKPLGEKAFAEWDVKVSRIVGDIPGKTAKPAELGTFTKQVERLENHFRACVGALQRVSLHTMLPVRDILGLVAKRKQHVKLVRKAA